MTDETQPPAAAPASPFSRPKPSKPRKPRKPRVYEPKRDAVSIRLPREFVALCAAEQVKASAVVQDFIADLCGIPAWSQRSSYATLGPAAQEAARAYHRVACQARRDKVARQGDSGADA
jgi:hypothetical protein